MRSIKCAACGGMDSRESRGIPVYMFQSELFPTVYLHSHCRQQINDYLLKHDDLCPSGRIYDDLFLTVNWRAEMVEREARIQRLQHAQDSTDWSLGSLL